MGYINKKEEIVINPQYDDIYTFSKNGLAPVKQNEKWGYINIKGETVINIQYDNAYEFGENKLAKVKIEDKYG